MSNMVPRKPFSPWIKIQGYQGESPDPIFDVQSPAQMGNPAGMASPSYHLEDQVLNPYPSDQFSRRRLTPQELDQYASLPWVELRENIDLLHPSDQEKIIKMQKNTHGERIFPNSKPVFKE